MTTEKDDRPASEPLPLGGDDFKLPTGVVFHTCTTPGCGEQSMRPGLCPKCQEAKDAKGKAKESVDDSVPKAFRWVRFEDVRVRAYVVKAFERVGLEESKALEAIQRAQEAIDSERVVLQGSAGKGKTTLAIAMMRAWTEKNRTPGLFVYAPDLQSARMRTKLGRESDLVVEATAAPLLVIDDVGAGTLVAGPLEEVVHKRHHDGKITWFTTWMLSASLAQRFGGGFARRVFEHARVIDLHGAK